MDNAPHFQRALLLHGQGRHDLAERELRQHLVDEPGDGRAHAVLALALVEQEKFADAEQAARDAIGHAPDAGLAHYALARVLAARNRDAEAAAAIAEAIRLDPLDPDAHALRAAIEFARGRWAETLAAAETCLAVDAEHVSGNNLRAMALVKLGRKTEAGETISAALARDPDNATTHANQGWTLLEQGRHREAMGHFRESLRLDPTGDWARLGMIEAIKAGNPLYAVLLRYFLWMQKLGSGAQWAILLVGFMGSRLLAGVAEADPAWAPWVNPFRIAYICFAILTWLAVPLANLVLFLHPFGRHALDDDQRAQARWVGGCVLLATASLAVWAAGRLLGRGDVRWLVPAIVFGALALPVSAIFTCQRGWPRRTMAAVAGALAAAGIAACVAMAVVGLAVGGFLPLNVGLAASAIVQPAMRLFVPGIVVSQFLANWLAGQRPTR